MNFLFISELISPSFLPHCAPRHFSRYLTRMTRNRLNDCKKGTQFPEETSKSIKISSSHWRLNAGKRTVFIAQCYKSPLPPGKQTKRSKHFFYIYKKFSFRRVLIPSVNCWGLDYLVHAVYETGTARLTKRIRKDVQASGWSSSIWYFVKHALFHFAVNLNGAHGIKVMVVMMMCINGWT